jgi:hypothetical protein
MIMMIASTRSRTVPIAKVNSEQNQKLGVPNNNTTRTTVDSVEINPANFGETLQKGIPAKSIINQADKLAKNHQILTLREAFNAGRGLVGMNLKAERIDSGTISNDKYSIGENTITIEQGEFFDYKLKNGRIARYIVKDGGYVVLEGPDTDNLNVIKVGSTSKKGVAKLTLPPAVKTRLFDMMR